MVSRSVRLRWFLVAIFALCVTAVAPCQAHGSERDLIRISATDAPDPVALPPAQSTLSVDAYVRKVRGIIANSDDDDDDDDCEDDQRRRHHDKDFFVQVQYTIKSSSGQLIRKLEKRVEIRPPFDVVRLPRLNGNGTRRFIRVPTINLAWDLRKTSGAVVSPGVYKTEVFARFERVHSHGLLGLLRHDTILDDSPTVYGTITVSGTTSPPPAISITAPANGTLTTASSISVTGSVSGGQAPVTVRVNGVAATITSGTYSSTTALSQGSNTITAVATDAAGRTSSATVTVTRDSVAPNLSIGAPAPGSSTTQRRPTIIVNYTDPAPSSGLNPGSAVATLDGSTVTFNVTATSASYTPPSNLTVGSHTVQFQIRDQAGNLGSASSTFTVAGPSLAIAITSPVNGALTTSSSITAIGSVSGGLEPVSVNVNGVAATITSDTFSATIALIEGSNTLTATATDAAAVTASDSRNVVRDSVAPLVTVATPASGASVSETRPTIIVSYEDPAPSSGLSLSTASGTLNGASVSLNVTASSATFTPASDLAAGQHTVNFEVRDQAGNLGTTSSTFTVAGGDRTPPPITITLDDVITSSYIFPTIIYSDAESGVDPGTFTATLDGEDVSWAFFVTEFYAAAYFLFLAGEGPHTLKIAISDHAGNRGEATKTFVSDTRAPSLALTPANTSVLASGAISLTATYSDSPGSGVDTATFVARVDGVERTGDFSVETGSASLTATGLAEGSHTFEASIKDRANHSTSAHSTFVVDTQPPRIAISRPSEGASSVTTTPRFVVEFADGDEGAGVDTSTLRIELDGTDITSSFEFAGASASFSIPFLEPLTPGSHVLRARISDRGGRSAEAEREFTVVPGEVPPVRVANSGFMTGSVLDGGGHALGGVQVTVRDVPGTLRTNDQGQYVFPTLGSGNFLLTFAKEGYTSAQRWVKIVTGRDSAVPPPILIPLDSLKWPVQAASGATIHDSTNRITIEIPPGALPRDMELTITDLPRSEVLPNTLPVQSAYLSCFTVEPGFAATVPVTVTYRLRTSEPFEVGSVVPVGRYSMELGHWVHSGMSAAIDDGLTLQGTVQHFSPCDLNTAVDNPHKHPSTSPDDSSKKKSDCPIVKTNSGVVASSGAFIEDHELPKYTGQSRAHDLYYSSKAADPRGVVQTSVAKDSHQTLTPDRRTFESSVGSQFQRRYYQPLERPALRYLWDAQNRDGDKVRSGSYPYQLRVSNDLVSTRYVESRGFGEPGIRFGRRGPIVLEPASLFTTVNDRLPIVNNRGSPLGAGWSLTGVSKLHLDPDGHLMLEDSGNAVVFSPSERLCGTMAIDTFVRGDTGATALAFDEFRVIESVSQSVVSSATMPGIGVFDNYRTDAAHKQVFLLAAESDQQALYAYRAEDRVPRRIAVLPPLDSASLTFAVNA